jgi:hypothetical protein
MVWPLMVSEFLTRSFLCIVNFQSLGVLESVLLNFCCTHIDDQDSPIVIEPNVS